MRTILISVLDFMKREWKFLLSFLLVVLVLLVGYYEYRNHKAVPMQTINSIDTTEIGKALTKAGVQANEKEVQYITNTIEKRVQSEPDVIYVTATQAEADKKAESLSKAEKADVLLKKTDTVATTTGQPQITNQYYSVHAEKSVKVKAGTTVVDSQAYANLGYQNGKNEVIIHYNPTNGKTGATYMRTIAEW